MWGVVAHSVERVSRGDHGFDSHSSDLNFLLVRPISVKCVRLVMVFVFSLSVAACEIFRDGRPGFFLNSVFFFSCVENIAFSSAIVAHLHFRLFFFLSLYPSLNIRD